MSRIPSSAHSACTLTHCLNSSLSGLHASCLSRSMDREAPCVSVHSPDVGLHTVLGLTACFWLWKLRTRTVRDQLHHQLVTSRFIVSAAWTDRHLCCFWNWTLRSRWRMKSSLNDRIYIFLILTLCFGFPTISIVTSYLVILLTVRPTQWWIWELCVCIFCDYFV